ncbi:hypothetical protein K458DRAFT_3203 [Lentithecium fluviatile CBS 122367]|uniref:Uncharacterized protein n=1 Tax=Lentithecium fluviatile CBS 122367 TaxID=1168545 RepID=A0A6G1JMZ5_9PLEO|nr:hypothetical protein K458DRAFT_3203 [Lentithecium fluviatile CBS 122367]
MANPVSTLSVTVPFAEDGSRVVPLTLTTTLTDPRYAQSIVTALVVTPSPVTDDQRIPITTEIAVTLPALPAASSNTAASSTVAQSPDSTPAKPTGSTASHLPLVGSGVSGGAVAGVAIGCLIAGAIIALIVCFFLYRRRNQKQSAPYHQSHLPYDTEHKSGVAVRTTPVPSAGMVAGSSLPQPVEDATISKEVSRIRDNIKNHVQNFYHYQPVRGGIGSSELTALAAATNLDAAVVEAMLVNTSTRGDTIRLFIAWAVLSRCEGLRQLTLLPLELAPVLEAISRQDGKDNVKSAWFRQWKVLTGALLEQQDSAGLHAANIDTQNWSNLMDSMDLVLGPFAQAGSDGGKRRRNLEMILARAAKLAFLLFSQPGSFHFDFTGSRQDSLVVFPSLVQVVGDEGQLLSPTKVLWEKEVATD